MFSYVEGLRTKEENPGTPPLPPFYLDDSNICATEYPEYVFEYDGYNQSFYDLDVIDISKADTSNVTNMDGMFSCVGYTYNVSDGRNSGKYDYPKTINISGINTSAVTNMSYMFANCKKLKELDLSGFDVSKVHDMTLIFIDCNELKTIYTSKDRCKKGITNFSMFNGSYALVGTNGTKCGYPNYDGKYARIDKEGQPGYFTYRAFSTVKSLGDINGDKALSIAETKRADVDNSGNVDIEDAVAVIAHVNGVKPIV